MTDHSTTTRAIGIALLIGFGLVGFAHGQEFSAPVVVSENGATPDLALNADGSPVVVWSEQGSNAEIRLKRPLTPAVNVSQTDGPSRAPALAVDGDDTAHVVWVDESSGNAEIRYRRLPKGSPAATDPINLSSRSSESVTPAIAVGPDGTVYVAWADDRAGSGDIFLARSADGGEGFSTPVNLSESEDVSLDPALDVQGGNALVVWTERGPERSEIAFRRSGDGGRTFSDAERVVTGFGAEKPAIAAGPSGEVYVTFASKFGNVGLVQSADAGQTFDMPTLQFSIGLRSDIAVDAQGNIYAVWEGTGPQAHTICFSFSTDGGRLFSPPLNFTDGGAPALAVGGPEAIFVAGHMEDGTVFFRKGKL